MSILKTFYQCLASSHFLPARRRQSLPIVGLFVNGIFCGSAWALVSQNAEASQPPTERIVGGTHAAAGDFPFMVSLHFGSDLGDPKATFYCGGTLVAPNLVLTAAHCVEGLLPSDIYIGSGHISFAELTSLTAVKRILVHPGYPASFGEHDDVALVELAENLSATPLTRLATFDDHTNSGDITGRTVGWGTTNPDDDIRPSRLSFVDIPIHTDEECTELSEDTGLPFSPDYVCAGTPETVGSACYGDSGGPLLVEQSDGSLILAGVVSRGISCYYVAFYADVAEYTGEGGWLSACMADLDTCTSVGPKFVCSDGLEIPSNWVCDGAPDCIDGADELDCPVPMFTCDDGSTIPENQLCDGTPQCPDGSDESVDICGEIWVCDDGTPIPADWVCDGIEDCPGSEDEDPILCAPPEEMFNQVEIEPGEVCPAGGTLLQHGSDTNKNGALDPEEISAETPLCFEPDRFTHAAVESPGSNCKHGGTRLESGDDANGDGLLEGDEISEVAYVCNDSNATDPDGGSDGDWPWDCSVSPQPRSAWPAAMLLMVAGLLRRRNRSTN